MDPVAFAMANVAAVAMGNGPASFTTLTSMANAGRGGRVSAANSKVFHIGGFSLGAGANNQQYDPVLNTWSIKADLPLGARYSHYQEAVAGLIYVMGGVVGGAAVQSCYAYNPVANTWSAALAVMTNVRQEGGSFVIGQYIHCVGGTDNGGTAQTSNYRYDTVGNTWAVKAVLATARQGNRGSDYGGFGFSFGGDGANIARTDRYDPAGDSWTAKTAIPTGVRQVACATLFARIYLVGGLDGSSTVRNLVQSYDPTADTWRGETNLPAARQNWASTAVLNNVFYVAGGSDGAGNDSASAYAMALLANSAFAPLLAWLARSAP